MNFFCLDVETANESTASICQIGIATFIDGIYNPERSIRLLVNPEDDFLEEFTNIHGITAEMVLSAPTFPRVHEFLSKCFENEVVLSHSPFDRASVNQACDKYKLENFSPRWLDTLRVARRTWPERLGNEGHRLSALADSFKISFRHHDALEDARCCGEIFLLACNVSHLSLDDWLIRAYQPLTAQHPIKFDGNPNGHLGGEVVVFTGSLSLTRREIATLAAQSGCRVDEGVTKHTTLVVVGIQDAGRLKGAAVSSKHKKALDLIMKGMPLKIITEGDLHSILKNTN